MSKFCDLNANIKHIGEVSTSRVDGSPTGAEILTSTNGVTGDVRDTLDGKFKKMDQQFQDRFNTLAPIPWTPNTLINENQSLQVFEHDGLFYLPNVKKLPFTTGVVFNADNWVLSDIVTFTKMRTDSASQMGLVYKKDWQAGDVMPVDAMRDKLAYWHNGQFYSVGTDTSFTSNDFATDLAAGRFVDAESLAVSSKITSTGSSTPRTLQDRFADVLDVKDEGIDDAQDKCGWEDSAALASAKALNSDNRTINERNFGNRTVKVWQKAEGIKDAAVAMSFSLAGDTEPSTQVANYNDVAHMAQYDNRDAVGLFGQAIAQPANVTTALTVFTNTSVTSNDFVGKDIKVGMTVEVFSPVRYVSIIESFTGNVITVSAWYEVGKTNVTGKPTDGNTLYVNRFTKIWGQNTNVIIPTGSGANSGTGFELGMACEKVGSGALSKGYDLITLWGEPVGIGYSSRGDYIDTFVSDANCVNAYRSKKGAQTSFRSEDASVYHYVALVNSERKFTVGANGSIYKHMMNGQVVSGNGTLSVDNSINVIVGSATGRSISLPDAELNVIMTIKNNTDGSITISGKTFSQYESKTFWSDGSSWNQIN